MKKKQIVIIGVTVSLFLITLSIMISFMYLNRASPEVPQYNLQGHAIKKQNLTTKDFKSSATLTAVGDILIHGLVYNTAKTTDGYDFTPMFSKVKPYLEKADLTFANQETMIGGVELGLSTYPRFNSPYEVATALQDSGVDIVSISNNHTLDRGEIALLNATAFYDQLGLPYTGAYISEEDSKVIRTVERNGITFAFLAYTYGTNGIPVPKGKPYLVNLIEKVKIESDIQKAKTISDVVVVSLHFGNEYERMPSNEQKHLAKEVVGFGADIILGHHPHVLQPMEWVEAENGHKGFVAYSLGNFLSSQQSIYREIGGILTLTIDKEIHKGVTKITVRNPEFISTYVSRAHNFKIVELETASAYGLPKANELFEDIDLHMFQLLPTNQLAQAN